MSSIANLMKFKWQWILFFFVILVAWTLLVAMQPGFQTAQNINSYGIEKFLSFCLSRTNDASYSTIVIMWMLMSVAMMSPTAIPAMLSYNNLPVDKKSKNHSLILFIGGFIATWFGFSVLAATFQIFLANLKLVDDSGQSTNLWLISILLIIAGLYQFSSLKNACIKKCRSPLTIFLEKWTNNTFNGLKLGIYYGVFCVGCCWALMSLAFVGGIMSLAWMTASMLLMTIEKLPDIGKYISKPIGSLCTFSGIVFLYLALTN